jgi:hypothetical protein
LTFGKSEKESKIVLWHLSVPDPLTPHCSGASFGQDLDALSIEAIIPFTKPPVSRRSLGRHNGPIIRVVAVVKGLWSLRDLEDELSERGLPMPVSRPVMKRHHIVNIQEKRLVRR